MRVDKKMRVANGMRGHAGANLRRADDQPRKGNRSASLSLPIDCEDIASFAKRVDLTLRALGSFVYIDTSFLMWLIKISPTSRQEFIRWLDGACGTRVAVPVWSLHELYRHHVEKRITNDLEDHLKKLTSTVGESFSAMWTLFDEPLNGAFSVSQQRQEARETLRAVRTLADRANAWKAGYERNAREVIEFANARALKGSGVLDQLSTIEAVAAARFTGRVPPGFQDKRKKPSEIENFDGEDVAVGSNRWGDLIFWQEILEHARQYRVGTVVILTKDVKNDWRMAGALPPRGQTDEKHGGVQPPHPMLSYEAARIAGAREVVLLDQGRLAEIMKRGPNAVAGFVTAAHPPSLPPPKSEAELRSEARERAERERARIEQRATEVTNLRFLDPPDLVPSDATILRALYKARVEALEMPALAECELVLDQRLDGGEIVGMLTSDLASRLGPAGLIAFARRLVTDGADDSRRLSAAADFASELESFPKETATFLFMGLLAGTYLDDENNLRHMPNGLVAQKLFVLLDRPMARAPIEQLRKKAKAATQLPLFLPSDSLPIVVEFKIDSELDRDRALRAIWIGDQNLLIDVQHNREMKLCERFSGRPMTPDLLLDHIADLYVLPRRQLGAAGTIVDSYSFDEFIGLRAPADLWRSSSAEQNQ